MKKIIISALICASYAPCLVVADNTALSAESLYRSTMLLEDESQAFGFIGRYDVGLGLKERDQITSYDLFSDDDTSIGNAWVGVTGSKSQIRVGRHDSVDNMATLGADQHKVDGAYDLIMRGEEVLPNSLTYINKSGPFAVGAQYADSDSADGKESLGVMMNTQQGPVEAAIGYRRTPENSNAIKGRVTYKSRNNSRIRVDVVAEKFAVGSEATENEVNADSTSFMVGAKYNVTPKAYVVGQYGSVGFERDSKLSHGSVLSRDYNALSFEAGYNLSDSTSIYVNHTQKSYNSSSFLTPFVDDQEGSQTNSIGVRLNW